MAAVRATREAAVKQGREELPVIVGTPLKGETIGSDTFDGKTETAIFPGDLPERPDSLFEHLDSNGEATLKREIPELRFIRFRPPQLETDAQGLKLSLPHIRLDRALEFLVGDQLA